MAFQPTTDAARVFLKHTVGDDVFGSVLWFTKPGFDITDMVQLTGLVLSNWQAHILGQMHTSVFMGNFVCYDMRTADGAVYHWPNAPQAGTQIGHRMPMNTCLVATFYTDKRGRSYRGRCYQGGYPEDAWEQTGFDAEVKNSMMLCLASLKQDTDLTGWTWGVRSGQVGGVKRESGIVTPITSYLVRSTETGSQRRRVKRA